MRIPLCGFLLTLAATPLLAEDHVVEGAGTVSCAVYTQYVRERGADVAHVYFSWAQGFMSGLNVLRGSVGKSVDLAGR